jgi:membrane-associated phospholipid phosphatase
MIELPAAFDTLDDAIDVWWDRFRDRPVLDRIFYTASEAADFSLMWHALGVVQAIIEDDPMIAIGISGALGIESALVNGPVKSMFRRRRPVQEGPRPHTLRQPRTSSFPSGHASAAMVAVALLSRHTGGVGWYAVGAVVATSRIHVRIHHASDVAGGLAVGAVLGVLARRILA